MKRKDITDLFPDATKEQIDRIMELNGEDINAAKSGIDQLKTTHLDELQAERDKTAGLQKQLDDLTAANSLRDIRDRISQETGVPVSLLTGGTEEECKTQAEAIKSFAGALPGYPTVKDGGEVTGTPKQSTREQFADWLGKQMN